MTDRRRRRDQGEGHVDLKRLQDRIKLEQLAAAVKFSPDELASRSALLAAMAAVFEQLRRDLGEKAPAAEALRDEQEWLELWANYTRGLKSPDEEERTDFTVTGTTVLEKIAAGEFEQVMSLLRIARHVDKRGRKPEVDLWRKDQAIFEKMKLLVEQGAPEKAAARQFASKAAGRGNLDSKARRLAHGYRLWAKRQRPLYHIPGKGISTDPVIYLPPDDD